MATACTFQWLTQRSLIFAATLAASAGSAQDAEKLTYDDHIRPLLENKCFSCHNPDKKKGGLELTSYAGLMNGGSGGAVVDAGNPQGSRLWTCSAKKEEPFMPPEGAPLEAKDLTLLSKWIADGVLQSKGSVAKTSTKPKVDLTFTGAAGGKPEGPPARPEHILLEPVLVTPRTSAIVAMAASPWTSLLAVAGQKQILLYDTDTHQLAGILPYTEGHARSLKFSANGALLIMGGGRGGKLGHAIVWDVRTGKRMVEIGKEFDQVMSADITPDHRKVAFGTNAKKVKCFDIASGEELYLITKHTEWITGTDFSPDGILLATADRNGNVAVWEADNGGEFYALGQHKGSVTDLAWRADSNVLASSAADGTVMTWEMKTGRRIGNWSAHGGNVLSIAFTPDGKLLSSGADGTTALWTIEGNRLPHAQGIKQNDQVSKIVALYDSKKFVTGNWLGEVRFFETDTGREITQVSSNPPRLADRLAATEKRLAELAPMLAPAEASVKDAETPIPIAETALVAVKEAGEPAAKKLGELDAKLAEQKKGLEYWQGMLAKAKTQADKEKAQKSIAAQHSAIDYFSKEAAKVRPSAEAFRTAEAALAKARGNFAAAQAKVRDIQAESLALQERIVTLKSAQFNVGVLSEQEKLAKLEQDIADLVAAKSENEAAKVSSAARIETSKKTIALNDALLPKLTAEHAALQAEFTKLDSTLNPHRLSESEALGKIEVQEKLIESHSEAIVRLGQDRDAAVAVSTAAAGAYAIKFTTPLRNQINDANTKAEALRKEAVVVKEATVKAENMLNTARTQTATARKSATAAKNTAIESQVFLNEAEKAYIVARSFGAIFSFRYFADKRLTDRKVALAKVTLSQAKSALELADKMVVTALASEHAAASAHQQAVAVLEGAEKKVTFAQAEIAALTKERARHLVERYKLAAPGVAAEKDYAVKQPTLQAALQKAKESLPALEKSLAEVRSRLAEAAKPVEAKRLQLEAAAKNLELARNEKANAEKALIAAEKDIPQRDKNLAEIAKAYAELTPQVEPMKAKVKAIQEQYFAMLPKREEIKKN